MIADIYYVTKRVSIKIQESIFRWMDKNQYFDYRKKSKEFIYNKVIIYLSCVSEKMGAERI